MEHLIMNKILKRQIHNILQGQADWYEFRETHHGASEAGIPAGRNQYIKYDDFLKWKSTGIKPELNDFMEKIYEDGHKSEAALKPLVEEYLGDELYNCVFSKGNLSASVDGITLDETIVWETKQYSKERWESVLNGVLPDEHIDQCQQILYVTEADKLLFTVASKNNKKFISVWVAPDPEHHKKLISLWEQFDRDVERVKSEGLRSIEEPKKSFLPVVLPTVAIVVAGDSISHNVEAARPKFDEFLSNARTVCVTDEDYAVAKVEAKAAREAAANCISMSKSIEVVGILVGYAEKFNKLAILQEKAVKGQENAIKQNAKLEYVNRFAELISNLSGQVSPVKIVLSGSDIPEWDKCMLHQQNMEGIHNKLSLEYSKASAAAYTILKDIKSKLDWFNSTTTTENRKLFEDLQEIIYKPVIEFKVIVQQRIVPRVAETIVEAVSDVKTAFGEEVKITLQGEHFVNTQVVEDYNPTRPTRNDIIKLVVGKYWCSPSTAESWLKEYFSDVPF